MKKSVLFGGAVAALVAFGSFVAQAAVSYWDDGAVVPVGCQGAGDNNNNNGKQSMIFRGSGTIHGTWTPRGNSPSSWAIWRNYQITNGTVVVDGVWDDAVEPPVYKNFTPAFRRGVMLGDVGKLVISNKASVTISSDATNQFNLVDVKGLSFIDKDVQPTTGKLILNSSVTVVRLPEDRNVTVQLNEATTKLRIAIAGPDFMARMGTTFNCLEVRIFNDNYIPDGATLTIGPNTFCLFSKRELDPVKCDFADETYDHSTPWTDTYGNYSTAAHPIDLSGSLKVESIESGTTFAGKVTGHGNATISLRGGVTHTFADVAGNLRFVQNNAGADEATLTFNQVAAGTRLFLSRGFTPDFTALAAQPSSCPVLDGVWYVFPDADGRIDLSGFSPSTKVTAAFDLVSADYDDPAVFGANKMAVGGGVEVSTPVNSASSTTFVMNGGTLKLAQDICHTATFWMDPSIDSTVYKLGTAIPQVAYDKIKGTPTPLTTTANGNDLVEAIADRRANHTAYCLRHIRHYSGVVNGDGHTNLENLPSVFPMRVKNGPNGLSYLSTGNDGSYRRIQTSTSPIDLNAMTLPNNNQINEQGMVIMVFGSQLGGGNAILGVSDASLNRPGKTKDDAIASNTFTGDIWIDGVKTSNTATLSGGWQVITFDITGHNIDCFGWANKDYQKSAGQNYGEVLIFKESLTDAERVSVESYLAEKWGITAYEPSTTDKPAAAKTVLYGAAGTVEITGDIAVSGNYRGGFAVGDGAKLIVPAADAMPPEPTTEGLLYRFDPSQEGALTIGTDDEVKVDGVYVPAVRALWPYGCTMETYPLGDYYLYGVSSRRPFVEKRTGGFATAERPWMNFAHPDNQKHNGNVLRFKAWDPVAYADDKTAKGGADKTVNIRTAIMVTDSAQGGGNLLQKGISDSGNWGTRTGTDATAPIWGSAVKAVTEGVTRLNGKAIDGTTTGFTGEAEVFVTQPTDAIGTAVLGRYGDTETKTTPAGGMILGEMLFYSTALTEAEIKTAEDYLLYKWLGVTPVGYGDLTGATVSGAGTVEAKKAADLPKFAADFAGTIAVTENATPTFAMAVSEEGQVSGALVAPAATLTGVTSGTINVSVPARTYGTFTLVDLKAVSAPVDWTVNVGGTISELAKQNKAKVAVAKDGASVTLSIVRSGMMLIVQ